MNIKNLAQTVLKDQKVLSEIYALKMTKGEVEKYFGEIVKLYYFFHSPFINGLSGHLGRDQFLKTIYFYTSFANNKGGRDLIKKQNIKLNILDVFMNDSNYRNASISYIQNNMLSWQTKHWSKITKFLDYIIEDKPTNGLYISGEFGIGKTYLNCAMANELALRGKSVAIFKTLELYEYLKNNRDQNQIIQTQLIECDVLIIDDLGREPMMPYASWFTFEFLYLVLNTRYLKRKHLIINSNLSIIQYLEMLKRLERKIESNNMSFRFLDIFKSSLLEIDLLKEVTSNTRKNLFWDNVRARMRAV